MSTTERTKARREATPEQKAAAIERKKSIRDMFAKIAAIPIEKRVILANDYGLRTAGEGRELSPSNTLLVMMQFPSASVVGGFEQWRKAGRIVKKGSRAIGIWVPMHKGEAGESAGEVGEDGERTFFIIGNVFDISQTVDAVTGEESSAKDWNPPVDVEEVKPVVDPARLVGPDNRRAALASLGRGEPLALPAPVAEYEAPEAVQEPEAVEMEVMEPEPVKPAPEAGELRAVSVERMAAKHHKSVHGYGVAVRYTWEDGTKSLSDVTARKVADLPAALERDARDVAAGCVTKQGGCIVKRFTMF